MTAEDIELKLAFFSRLAVCKREKKAVKYYYKTLRKRVKARQNLSLASGVVVAMTNTERWAVRQIRKTEYLGQQLYFRLSRLDPPSAHEGSDGIGSPHMLCQPGTVYAGGPETSHAGDYGQAARDIGTRNAP